MIGCGYLGARAARLWTELGHHVCALTRSVERAEVWRQDGWEPVVGDVTQPTTLAELPSVDTCMYAVGFDRTAAVSKREVYVNGLRHVLDALRGKCPRLIYISSSSVYGQDDGDFVDADSICQPASESGQICLDAEHLIEERADQFNAGACVVRLTGIYGPNRLLTRVDQLQSGVPLPGRADAWLNLIHVDDAAQTAVMLAGQTSVDTLFERYLLTDERPIERADFYGHLATLTGAPAPTFDLGRPTRSGNLGLGKRCCARKIREQFKLQLRFPTIETGLPDALARTS